MVRYDRSNVVLLSEYDQTCDDVCEAFSRKDPQNPYVCDGSQLQFLNRCSMLRSYFPCEKGCWNEVGQDLPAYVAFGEPEENGVCLFSYDVQPICEFAMEKTRRLCVCTPKRTRVEYSFHAMPIIETRKALKKRKQRLAKTKCHACWNKQSKKSPSSHSPSLRDGEWRGSGRQRV